MDEQHKISFNMDLVGLYGLCPFIWVKHNAWDGVVDLCAHRDRDEDIMRCDANKWTSKCPFIRKAVGG